MKKPYISTLLIVGLFTILVPLHSVMAQDGIGLKLSLGWSQMPVEAGTYFLVYIDDSPSRDNLSTTRSLEAKPGGFNLYAALYAQEGDVHLDLGILGMFSQASFVAIDLGMGVNFLNSMNVEGDQLRAGVQFHLGVGQKSVYMGDLDNNDLYIQINGSQFYQNYLSVHLKSLDFTARPGVFGSFQLTEKLSLTLEADYHIRLFGFEPRLVFTGEETGNGDPTKARERFDDPNVRLASTGAASLEKLPIKINGFQARMGVAFILQ